MNFLEFLEEVVPLLIAAGDGVVDGKDVLGIDDLFDLVLPVNCNLRQSPRDKLLPDFSHSMVMRDATSTVHDLISRSILDDLIVVNHLVVIDSLMS